MPLSPGNRWTRQPPEGTPIDWGHPWARGLVDCYVGNGRRSPIHNGLLASSAATVTPIAQWRDGMAINSPISSLEWVNSAPARNSDEYTQLVIASPNINLADNATISGYGNSGTNNTLVMLAGAGATNLKWWLRNDASSGSTLNSPAGAASDAGWAVGEWSVLAGVYSASRNSRAMWLNGSQVASATAPALGTLTVNTTSIGGLRRTSAGLYANVSVALHLAWGRALENDELERITRSLSAPWALWEPQRVWVQGAAVGGAPTLSASTFVPGSITSAGWRPRVTATY